MEIAYKEAVKAFKEDEVPIGCVIIKDGEVITTTYTTVGEANSTATTILTALKTQLDEDTVVNAAVANETLTISNQVSGTALAIEVNSMLEMETGSVTESIAETMAACMVSDSDWYGISLAERNETEILEMADWVEANNKLFGALTSAEGAKQSDVTNDMLTNLKKEDNQNPLYLLVETDLDNYLALNKACPVSKH